LKTVPSSKDTDIEDVLDKGQKGEENHQVEDSGNDQVSSAENDDHSYSGEDEDIVLIFNKPTKPLSQDHETSSSEPDDVESGASTTAASAACSHREEQIQQQQHVTEPCAICLEPYRAGDTVVWSATESCPHVFHKDCFVHYLLRYRGKGTPCPSCRQSYCDESVFCLSPRVDKQDNSQQDSSAAAAETSESSDSADQQAAQQATTDEQETPSSVSLPTGSADDSGS